MASSKASLSHENVKALDHRRISVLVTGSHQVGTVIEYRKIAGKAL